MSPPLIVKESVEEIQHPHVEVPTKTRFLWGLGGFADATIVYGTGNLASLIYINALQFNAAMVSLACALPRFLDLVTDPMLGHFSDNTRSRWGRRRPWMLAGLLLSCLPALLLWHPPSVGGGAVPSGIWQMIAYCVANPTFWYLAVMMTVLFSVGYSSYSIAHSAMGYEMSTDYNERTHLFKWRYLAFSAAGFLTPWFMPLCLWIEGPRAQTWKGSHGIITVSYLVGAVILLTGLPSIIFCKENTARHTGESKVRFIDALRFTLENKPFWLLVVSNFVTKFLMNFTGVFFFYIFVYGITGGRQAYGASLLAFFFNAINIASLLAMPVAAAFSDRIGKRFCLLFMLAMSAVAYGTVWLTLGSSPGSFLNIPLPWSGHSIAVQWPCLITAVLIGAFTNTMPMIKNSMLADVCDLDELKCGHRRDAFYGAVFVTTDKIAMAVAMAFQGFLLIASGFNSALDMQSPGTMRFWLLTLAITQPLGCLLGITAIFFYPLTREGCHEIRARLDAAKSSGTRITETTGLQASISTSTFQPSES